MLPSDLLGWSGVGTVVTTVVVVAITGATTGVEADGGGDTITEEAPSAVCVTLVLADTQGGVGGELTVGGGGKHSDITEHKKRKYCNNSHLLYTKAATYCTLKQPPTVH